MGFFHHQQGTFARTRTSLSPIWSFNVLAVRSRMGIGGGTSSTSADAQRTSRRRDGRENPLSPVYSPLEEAPTPTAATAPFPCPPPPDDAAAPIGRRDDTALTRVVEGAAALMAAAAGRRHAINCEVNSRGVRSTEGRLKKINQLGCTVRRRAAYPSLCTSS